MTGIAETKRSKRLEIDGMERASESKSKEIQIIKKEGNKAAKNKDKSRQVTYRKEVRGIIERK